MPEIGQIFFDPHQETIQVWDGTGWKIIDDARSMGQRIPSMTPVPFDVDFEVKVTGWECKIEEGSDLQFKIIDTISWMLIGAFEKAPSLIERVGGDNSLLEASKLLLESELLTNVLKLKVERWNDHLMLKTFIGFAIKLDQSYIDNYADVVNQQLVNAAVSSLR